MPMEKERAQQYHLCTHGSQNLVHVMNSCKAVLDMGRFNQQQDGVLARIVKSAKTNVVNDVQVIADFEDGYNSPLSLPHMACTDRHPDVVW